MNLRPLRPERGTTGRCGDAEHARRRSEHESDASGSSGAVRWARVWSFCEGDFPVYRLKDPITVKNGLMTKAELQAESGPLEGFPVTASGLFTYFCDDIEIELTFPISVDLSPHQSTHLALDLPSRVNVILDDMILFDESNRSRYRIGSKAVVNTRIDLTARPGYSNSMSVRMRYAGDAWACVAVNSDENASEEDSRTPDMVRTFS